MQTKSLKSLAITFAIGGVWDTIAGILYIFFIGTGRSINNPSLDPFYAIFLGSFFLCFAWLQILSSFNIRRYAFNVGCLVFGRNLCRYKPHLNFFLISVFNSEPASTHERIICLYP